MGDVNGWVAILGAIGGLIVALSGAIPVIVSAFKKSTKNAEEAAKQGIEAIKQGDWVRIGIQLVGLIQEAEKFISFTGAQKKEWVIAKIIMFCNDNGIAVELEKIAKEIDVIVALTRKVNADGKYLNNNA